MRVGVVARNAAAVAIEWLAGAGSHQRVLVLIQIAYEGVKTGQLHDLQAMMPGVHGDRHQPEAGSRNVVDLVVSQLHGLAHSRSRGGRGGKIYAFFRARA